MVYTFYSYKGGVGRSMALVNIAELMYQAGLKVVMVDWDLDAPGLEQFYKSYEPRSLLVPQHKGLIDLLLDYKYRISHHNPEQPVNEFEIVENLEDYLFDIYGDNRLWLLPAGQRANLNQHGKLVKGFDWGDFNDLVQYTNSVKAFDWGDFYANWEGEIYFEILREKLESFADVILIDSPRGVTEMGGTCIYQLADVVVLFCSPYRQSLEGTVTIVKNLVDNPVLKAIRDNRLLKTLVIPARIEMMTETFELNQFRNRFNQEFAKYSPYELNTDDYFAELEIPYIPLYSFSERIATKYIEIRHYRSPAILRAYNKLLQSLVALAPKESVIRKNIPLNLTDL